eukprot:TRINITY_DN5046_c0_g1_i5.p1 TRINITY_DN5046_c0_g1~~TRINITY_DN5046_c0_g1_i5.p1  ORF type:complete len:206 (+),score=57.82 TRINITY_DN5046_c0_g1_i5:423-1040(+)
MENLRILSLGRNLIKKLDNLDSLSHLEELWLSYNWISSLAGIENLKNLKVLYLGNNHINKFRELHRLVELPDLQELVLYGNPIHTESVERNGEINWASSVLALLPQLKKFDGVTAVEWKSRREVGNEHQLRKVFKLIDTDGGGSLSQDELRASMKDPKIAELVGMDPIEIEPILIKILAAGGYDEECSFEDFCYWFSNAGSIGGM